METRPFMKVLLCRYLTKLFMALPITISIFQRKYNEHLFSDTLAEIPIDRGEMHIPEQQ